MAENGNKIKHLEFIQNVITRMNTNSFLIKGWNIVIVAALFALAAKDSDSGFIYLAFFPTIVFWGLDAFYLRQERLFRFLYDDVCKISESNIDFKMSTKKYSDNKEKKEEYKKARYGNVIISSTLLWFYFSIILIISFLLYFAKNLNQ